MAYLNKIMLIGNVGSLPQVRTFENGNKVASFSLATTKKRKDSQDSTMWHNIQVWGYLVDVVARYVEKGSSIYVEGELTERSWKVNDGSTKTVYEVKASDIVLLSSRSSSDSRPAPQQEQIPVNTSTAPVAPPQAPTQQIGGDDLPF